MTVAIHANLTTIPLNGRLVQVDGRKRLTLPEMASGEMYFLRSDGDGGFVLEPAALVKPKARAARYLQEKSEEVGRFVRLDSRRRLTIYIAQPHGLYIVRTHERGIIQLVPAVALPRAEFQRMKADFNRRMAIA